MSPPASPYLIDSGPLLREAGLIHRVLEPVNPGPYPTVVMLHGRAGNEEVMWIFRKTIPVHWLKIAPRGIVADPWGGYSWLSQEHGYWPDLAEFAQPVEAIQRFITALPTLYNADPARTYLMGFSQGAATAYATAMTYPGLVQAIAGLVGFMPQNCHQSEVLKNLAQTPIFMAVGKKDKRIPYEQGLNCRQLLRQAQANLTYLEYDTGHKLNAQGFNDLQAWWNNL